jgi:replicative DNA helicase
MSQSNSSSQSLYIIDYEKQFLSAVIRTEGAVLADTPHITAADFSETNRVVFNAIQSCLAGGSFNRFILVQKLNGLNIKIGGVIEPEIYVNAIADLNGVSDKAAIEISKQIKQVTIRRELDRTIDQMKLLVKNSKDMKASELVAAVTGTFNSKVNLFSGSDEREPQDLYGTIPAFLNQPNEYESASIPSPFPTYNDLYGYFDPGSIYCIVARMKIGKSSFAMSMLQQMALMDKDDSVRALILDTELSIEEVQSRIVASLSGVKEFYIRHKIYKKRKDMKERVEKVMDQLSPLWKKIDHVYIGGWDLEEQLSAARRWHAKNIKGKSKRGIIALDYFKLNSGADYAGKESLSMKIAGKVDAYKNLVKKELHIPMISFAQANREGEDSKAGGRMQNSTVIAGSDAIAQFCSNIYLLEKLSMDDRVMLNQLTPESATHSLKILAPRQLGPNEMGKDRLVKFTEENALTKKTVEKWCENYLLFSFNNFVFKETNPPTFGDMIDRLKITGVNVQKPVAAEAADGEGFVL